ncbi:MAG: trypsin-like peptidase domain-containing protein [Planctomycetes bacterium]|nr:trypsin-like peptidase domain-containing protein [Planctomycetota bacterium]
MLRRDKWRWMALTALALSFTCGSFLVRAADPPAAPSERPTAATSLVTPAAAEDLSELPQALRRAVPDGLDDLLTLEERVKAVTRKVLPATVGVRIGRAQGSGVIISRDGYVLTAAHVIGKPGRDVDILLPDGRPVKAVSLGLNRDVDAGLIKIAEDGPWPHVEMGKLADVQLGEWCLATGHPGGYQADRPPVLRLGRVIQKSKSAVQTDCTLVGGDSGGPLFDLRGRVIGINSRIGRETTWNFHVPITAYDEGWERLAASEDWGGPPPPGSAFLGVGGDDHADGCRVTEVSEGFAGDKAGLKVGDIIVRFGGRRVKGFDDLAAAVRSHKPGEKVEIELLRDGEDLTVTAELSERK